MRTARLSFVLFAIGLLVAFGASAQAQWADEFNAANGTAVDSATWGYDVGGGGWGNNELEVYNSGTANAWQENGYLRIQAKCCYTSARIKTQGKKTFSQGTTTEFRLRGPMGQGLWPAGWALGANITSVPWPGCGEIDIMEHINSIGNNVGTIHWDFGGHASYVASQPAMNFPAWNNYGLEWTSSLLRWKLNGAYVGDANIAGAINGTEEFGAGKPFFLIFNVAVGGDWPGAPNSSTAFPANLDVDWLHITITGQATPTTPPRATATTAPRATATTAPRATATTAPRATATATSRSRARATATARPRATATTAPRATATTAPRATATSGPGGRTLVWSDEFNGSGAPNSANWNYHVGNGYNAALPGFQGWGNGEWEWYRPENSYQSGGNLVIRADYFSTPTSIAGLNWYQRSGRITTQGKLSWTYGRIEARIQMPNITATWPAFWMMGTSSGGTFTSNYNAPITYYDSMATNWASCGEADIVEHKNSDTVIYNNIFWDLRTGVFPWTSGQNANYGTTYNVGNVNAFHVYAIEWDATFVRWFTDGVQTHVIDITPGTLEEFHKPMYLILNLAIAGAFPATTPNIANFPAYMYVDYVRVYQ